MLRSVGILFVTLLSATAQISFSQSSGDVKPFVYKVRASECSAGDKRNLTGFLVPGEGGIVTALHGVVGCSNLRALSSKEGNEEENVFRNLQLSKVDLANDVALLTSDELGSYIQANPGQGLAFSAEAVSEEVPIYVVGFPLDVRDSRTTRQIFIEDTEQELVGMIPSAEVDAFTSCGGSPDTGIFVFSLEGSLRPGESGAPIFNENHQVIGVGMGGLDGGRVNIVWASRWHNVNLIEVSSIGEKLAQRAEQTCLTNRFASGGDIEEPTAKAALKTLTKEVASDAPEQKRRKDASGQEDSTRETQTNDHLKEEATATKLEETVKRLQRDPSEAKQQALTSLAEGDLSGAIGILENEAQAPDQAEDPQARSRDLLDIALLASFDDPEQALSTLERAVELDPNNLDARLELGSLQVDLGRLEEGLGTFQSLLDRAEFMGDEEYVDVLNELSFIYLDLYEDSADEAYLEFAEQTLEDALGYSQLTGYREGEVDTLSALGFVHLDRGDYSDALEDYEMALSVSQQLGDKESEIYSLYGLGDAYYELENYGQAFSFYQDALAISQLVGASEAEIGVLNNIGNSYFDLGDFGEALVYHHQALDVSGSTDYSDLEIDSHTNLGDAYLELGDYDQALEHYGQALEISRATGNAGAESFAQSSLGGVYYELGEYDQALEHFGSALEISRAIGDSEGEFVDLSDLGDVFYELEQYDQALEHYEQALEVSLSTGDSEGEGLQYLNLGDVYWELDELEEAAGYYESALNVFEKIGSPLQEEARDALTELEEGE